MAEIEELRAVLARDQSDFELSLTLAGFVLQWFFYKAEGNPSIANGPSIIFQINEFFPSQSDKPNLNAFDKQERAF